MLVQFKVKNFKCFAEEMTLSMVKSNQEEPSHLDDNVIDVPKFSMKLLKTAVVYGANASGKSKLIEAMQFVHLLILYGNASFLKDAKPSAYYFALKEKMHKEPICFEYILLIDKELYRYGIELDAQHYTIQKEWLYYRPKTKEIRLFERHQQHIEYHKTLFSKAGILVKNKMIPNTTLLLKLAADFNEAITHKIIAYFDNTFPDLDEFMSHKDNKDKIIRFLSKTDIGLRNIVSEKNHKNTIYKVQKTMYDQHQTPVNQLFEFRLVEDEAASLQMLLERLPTLLHHLHKGADFGYWDDIDIHLHSILLTKIIQLFYSKTTNPNDAQLIFTTHNTHLLSPKLFRRDQIWFVEKDKYGMSSLCSLANIPGVRADKNYEKEYLEGRFGAIPHIQQLL